jgi:hypothetical protein
MLCHRFSAGAQKLIAGSGRLLQHSHFKQKINEPLRHAFSIGARVQKVKEVLPAHHLDLLPLTE